MERRMGRQWSSLIRKYHIWLTLVNGAMFILGFTNSHSSTSQPRVMISPLIWHLSHLIFIIFNSFTMIPLRELR